MSIKNISYNRIKNIVSNFQKSSIMVIGDSMLDEYIWGDVSRISPEAPVPVVKVESRSFRLGGAANVAQNLKSLGINTYLISLCGQDSHGKTLKEMLENLGCTSEGLLTSSCRPTTIKTRIIARHQQVVRVDEESVVDLTEKEIKSLLEKFYFFLPKIKGIIISDYSKGVISKKFISRIIKECKKRKIFIAIDPKERHFSLYKGVNIITPNLKEAHAVLGLSSICYADDKIEKLGWKIINKLNLPYLLITLSEKGMALFERDSHKFTHLPTRAKKVFDVTGAGDTVISVYTASIISNAKPIEAAFLSNVAAGITVGEIGTAFVTPQQILEMYNS
jgi:D-beta-D-heptose 7-phosphate kinase/D-beta-D-heptose 1-phosphate adenosyltransferase